MAEGRDMRERGAPGARTTGRNAAGSSKKIDAEAARQKARERKAEALTNLPEDVSISTIH